MRGYGKDTALHVQLHYHVDMSRLPAVGSDQPLQDGVLETVAAALEGLWDKSSAAAAAANADYLGASNKAALNFTANYNGRGGPVSTLPLPQQADIMPNHHHVSSTSRIPPDAVSGRIAPSAGRGRGL